MRGGEKERDQEQEFHEKKTVGLALHTRQRNRIPANNGKIRKLPLCVVETFILEAFEELVYEG